MTNDMSEFSSEELLKDFGEANYDLAVCNIALSNKIYADSDGDSVPERLVHNQLIIEILRLEILKRC